MKLKSKILIYLVATLIVTIAIVFSVQSSFFVRKYSRYEKQILRKYIPSTLQKLLDQTSDLDLLLLNWAKENVYQSLSIQSETDFSKQLIIQSLKSLGVTYIGVFDQQGKPIFVHVKDIQTNQPLELQSLKDELIIRYPFLIQHQNKESAYKGLLAVENIPLLLVSRPIINHNSQMIGTMIVGLLLNHNVLSKSYGSESFSVNFYSRSDPSLPKDVRLAFAELTPQNPVRIETDKKSSFSVAYHLISDLTGFPEFLIKVNTASELEGIRNTTLMQLIVVILVSGVIIVIVVLVLINHTVLRRLLKFDKEVTEITKKGNTTIRLTDLEKDELSNLTANINEMVTNLVQLAENAKEQERRFRDILTNIRMFGVILDQNFEIRFVNEYFISATGYQERELLGKNFFDLFIPDISKEQVKNDFLSLLEYKQHLAQYENDFVTKDKKVRRVSINVTLMLDLHNNISGLALLAQDITDYITALQSIEKREKYLSSLTQTAQLLLFNRGDIPFNKFAEIVGIACEANAVLVLLHQNREGSQSTLKTISEWYSQKYVMDDFATLRNSKSYYDLELSGYYQRFSSGETIYCNYSDAPQKLQPFFKKFKLRSIVIVPLITADEFKGLLFVANKIVELSLDPVELNFLQTAANYLSQVLLREQIYRTLELETTYLAGLFESAPEGLVIFNPNNTIRLINQKFYEMFGYTKEELIGQELDDFIVPTELKKESKKLSEKVMKGEYINHETIRISKDGKKIAVSILGAPIQFGKEVHGVIGIYRDISDKKKQEEEIKESNKRNELLYKLTGLITNHQRLEEIYHFAFEHIDNHYGVKKQSICFIESDGQYHLRATFNLNEKEKELTKKILETYIEHQHLRENIFFYSDQINNEYLVSIFQELNIHTIGCFPILSNRLPIGFYFVYFSEKHEFSEAETRIYEAITDTLSNSERHFRSSSLLKQSEERFRTLFHSAKDGYALLTNDLEILDVNPAFCKLIEKKKFELIGKILTNEVPIEFAKLIQFYLANEVDLGDSYTSDLECKRNNLNKTILEITITKIKIEKDTRFFISIRDVTETRRSEKLQAFLYEVSRAANLAVNVQEFYETIHFQLRLLFPAQNFYIALYDPNTDKYTFPYQVDEYDPPIYGAVSMKGTLTDFVRSNGQPFLVSKETYKELVDSKRIQPLGRPANSWMGVPLTTKHGIIGVAVIQTYDETIYYNQQDLDVFALASEQIAVMIEKKRVEDQIIQSELRYRQLFVNNKAIQLLIDPTSGLITDANDAACQYYGYEKEDLLNLTYSDIHTLSIQEIKSRFSDVLQNKINIFESRHKLANNVIRDVEEFLSPVVINDKTLIYAILHDITSRKEAEAEVKRLVTLVESTSEAIIITDENGFIVYVNPAFTEFTGYSRSEVQNKTHLILKYNPVEDKVFDEFDHVMQSGEVWSGRTTNVKKDGSIYYGDATVVPLKNSLGLIEGYAKIERDITKEIELQEKLERSQRLASVGQLTAGVAHNFNNLLTAILGNIGLAKMISNPEAIAYLNIAEQAGNRATDIVRQLLVFSRKKQPEKKVINIKLLLNEVTKLVRETIDKRIEFTLHEPKEDLTIIADASQLHEVIINICMNASDALKAVKESSGKPKRIDIIAEKTLVTKDQAEKDPEAYPGEFVKISISDTGIGMTPEVIKHIFEPFFTTKEQGKGTGLGLATVFGIVKQHEGWITVESQLYVGTTFHLYFPFHHGTVEISETKSTLDSDLPRGNETILLIDDEEVIRFLGTSILSKLGYKVLTASNGREGWELYQKHSDEIKLILLDLLMPVMSGAEMLRLISLSQYRPKIIICTGMSEEPIPTIPGIDTYSVISKPYRVIELANVVRSALDTKKE
ncbi:MAG: PAS domain S-box protein [bacterium]|nr:PAS domain S-box protein [bacterium]